MVVTNCNDLKGYQWSKVNVFLLHGRLSLLMQLLMTAINKNALLPSLYELV